jgi:hypothetical protein
MAKQRFTMKLKQLRCIQESDSGPSEPYIWATYFALGPQIPQFQTGPLAMYTPAYDAFRTEFPDNVSAGSVVNVPTFMGSGSFDMDLDMPGPKLIGCVVILLEQDDTRNTDMVYGRIAYSKEMEKQLNSLMQKRIQSGDSSDLTKEETDAIKAAVTSKVEAAVGGHQSAWDLFRDQDDSLGFTYKILPGNPVETIHAQTFEFPEIVTKDDGDITDRYVLTGELIVSAVPGGTVDLCAGPRAAVAAKKQEISSLQHRVTSLQNMLHHATPQQKAAIIREIGATNEQVAVAQGELGPLEAALQSCLDRFNVRDDLRDVVVGPMG